LQEDRHKTTFATEWGSYQYTIMPFGLKNAPAVFSRVVVATFKEFIHKFLEVYLDDWTVFSLLKDHIEVLQAHVGSVQTVSYFTELEEVYFLHTIWNFTRTCSMQTRTISRSNQDCSNSGVRTTYISQTTEGNLGHTGYYRKFIKGYAQITTPMEKLLKKEAKFQWNEDCQKGLDTLKQKLGDHTILIFPDWNKEFHVHVDASSIALGTVLSHNQGKGDIDHPIAFASRKLSIAEKNYTTTEREGLAMVYALQKFRHYLLGSHFKMYTDHSALKYLVNKPVLGGRICRWLLLFQEYDFEVVVKPGKLNAGPDHLSHILTGEDAGNLDDNFPDAQLFAVKWWMITSQTLWSF
jgi:hypothetical protein